MTDQDPTQRYEPPATVPPATPPPATSGAPAGTPSFAPPAPPAPDAVVANTDAPAPVVPVAATPRGKASRLRWAAVAVVVLLVAGTAAGATLLLTSDSADPDVLRYAPADSVVYTELRLDLPGDQEAELAAVMSAFPGFDDQAAFPVKLDEALDQLLGRATDGKQSWTGDIDPWFGGQLSVSAGPLPESVDAVSKARGLLLASVTDAAKAEAWAAALVAEEGGTTATETYGGVTITTVTPPSGEAPAEMHAAYAIVGPVLAVGDVDSVKAAIDTKGTGGLDSDAQFQAAEATVSGDRLAFAYVDTGELAASAKDLAGDAASMVPGFPAGFGDAVPAWTAAALRADNGAFVIDTRMPHVDSFAPTEATDTTLANVVPPTTVALAEGHDVGGTLTRLKAELAGDPALADGVKQVEDTLAILGGWDAVVGWMGEAGVAVTRDGDAVGGGLVVAPTDAAAAGKLLTQISGFAQLAGAGADIKVEEEPYGGSTITVITLGDVGALTGGVTEGSIAAPEDIVISYAVTDEVVVIGYGTDFTKGVLDARAGDSLGDTERFKTALAQAGPAHSSLLWLDVTGIRDLVEAQVPADEKAGYEADVKPYLEAFDSVIGTLAPAEDIDRGTVIIRVIED